VVVVLVVVLLWFWCCSGFEDFGKTAPLAVEVAGILALLRTSFKSLHAKSIISVVTSIAETPLFDKMTKFHSFESSDGDFVQYRSLKQEN
jgi:hypothetical protein